MTGAGHHHHEIGKRRGTATVQSRPINKKKGRHGRHPTTAQRGLLNNENHITPQSG